MPRITNVESAKLGAVWTQGDRKKLHIPSLIKWEAEVEGQQSCNVQLHVLRNAAAEQHCITCQ
jgi:hypothetical protein